MRVCEQEKISIIPGTEGTGEFLRYTPRDQVAAVRAALGEIDLDPASDALGQKTVGAIDYFAVEDNSLEREWPGRVFLNPPYNRNLAPTFISKLLQEIEAGRTTAAILLTNNCTDTDWFDVALRRCAGVCFTHSRIRFTKPDGSKVVPNLGQAFFYFGPRRAAFRRCVLLDRQLFPAAETSLQTAHVTGAHRAMGSCASACLSTSRHEPAAQAIEALAREKFQGAGPILVRIGKPPKRAISFRTDEPLNKIVARLREPAPRAVWVKVRSAQLIEIDHLQASQALQWAGELEDRLQLVAKARGYKRGWVFCRVRELRDGEGVA